MTDDKIKKGFRNAWILVVAALIFILVSFLFVWKTNENQKEPSWRMGDVPFVPASSHYGNGYYNSMKKKD